MNHPNANHLLRPPPRTDTETTLHTDAHTNPRISIPEDSVGCIGTQSRLLSAVNAVHDATPAAVWLGGTSATIARRAVSSGSGLALRIPAGHRNIHRPTLGAVLATTSWHSLPIIIDFEVRIIPV